MNDCTCTNCIFIDNGMRYCYDCQKYSKMPRRDDLERMIEEKRLMVEFVQKQRKN